MSIAPITVFEHHAEESSIPEDPEDPEESLPHFPANSQQEQFTYYEVRSAVFLKIFAFKSLEYVPWIASGIFIPLYGAQWFGECLDPDSDAECSPDFSTYNLFNTMFLSIGGIVSFFSAAFIGRLTDSFGRKVFLCADLVAHGLPFVVMSLHVNFWVYWAFDVLSYTNASATATKGYIADIIAPDLRTRAFGKMHISIGAGLMLGVGIVMAVSAIWNNHALFYVLSAWYAFLLLYTAYVVPETIDLNSNRKRFSRKSIRHPFYGLMYAFKHRVMLYIALTALCISMCQIGVMSSLLPFIGTEFDLDSDQEANSVFSLYVLICSVALVPASGYLLPWLKQQQMMEPHIVILSLVLKVASLFVLAALQLWPNLVVLSVSAALFGASSFAFPALNGMLTKLIDKQCQGTAFGITSAYVGVSGIVAPFGFGALYVGSLRYRMQFLFPAAGVLFCVIAIFILQGPLARELTRISERSASERSIKISSYSFGGGDDDDASQDVNERCAQIEQRR